MGLFDSVGRVLGIGGADSAYQAAPINADAFKDPNAAGNKDRVNSFLTAFQGANQTYSQPQAQQITSGQMGLVNTLQGRVNGTAPSVAQTQLNRGLESNLEALIAASQSSRGSNYGQQTRALSRAAGQANAQTNAEAATLRAQEQATAEQTLGSVLSNMQQTQQQGRLQGEQLIQNYLQMGLSIDQAQFLANQDLAKSQAGIAAGNADRLQRTDAALLGAVAAGGAAYAGAK